MLLNAQALKHLILLILITGTLFQVQAIPSRKKKKQSFVSKVYHNTTARYNGYFYAKLKMAEAEAAMTTSDETEYDQILDLFPTLSANASAHNTAMDAVVEKSEKVIQKHRRSKWKDDCNLLIGKAYIYLGEYQQAIEHFLFITSDYIQGKEKPKKKKKKRRRRRKRGKRGKKGAPEPESKILELLDKYKITHQEAYYDAIQWLVLAYLKANDPQQGMIIADLVINDPNITDDGKLKLALVQSYLYLKQEDFSKAILPLKKASTLTKNRKKKARLLYILGQTYKKLGQITPAIEQFEAVVDLKSDYDLDFHAHLQIASTFQNMSSGTNSNIKGLIKEMITNENNFDRLDQLYYTLGNIVLTQGDVEEALLYYDKSIDQESDNKKQEGLSYLKKGEVYYSQGLYIQAATMYDSALVRIDKSLKNIETIHEIGSALISMKIMMLNVELQDSVQELSRMEKEEVDDLIESLIEREKQEIAEAEAEALAALNAQNQGQFQNRTNSRQRGNQKWYFYNENSKTIGFSTFTRKWGNRKLEDNWRRKNKSTGFEENEDTYEEELSESDLLDPKFYWANIPTTEEKMKASHESIQASLYGIAMHFKNDLKENNQAIIYLNKLIRRYPRYTNAAQLYYNLYLLHLEEENESNANKFKELIITRYPKTKVAQYLNGLYTDSKEERLASEILQQYESQHYESVITLTKEAQNLLPKSPFYPSWMWLQAKSHGYLNRTDSLAIICQNIVKNYAGHPVAKKAESLLGAMESNGLSKDDIFIYRPTTVHFVVIFMDPPSFSSSNITVELADMNKRVFKRKDYTLANTIMDAKTRMVVVKSFTDAKEGKIYLEALKKDKKMKSLLASVEHELVLLSKINYGKLQKSKALDKYMKFYQENYK